MHDMFMKKSGCLPITETTALTVSKKLIEKLANLPDRYSLR